MTETRSLTQETRSERDSVALFVGDTLREVTTVTVQLGAAGDTVRVSTVTDRTRASVRDRAKAVEVRTEVRVDTVYLERKDSVYVSQNSQISQNSQAASLVSGLRWVFWIIVALAGLILVFRFGKKGILW